MSLSVSDFTLPDICCIESIRTASHGFFCHKPSAHKLDCANIYIGDEQK